MAWLQYFVNCLVGAVLPVELAGESSLVGGVVLGIPVEAELQFDGALLVGDPTLGVFDGELIFGLIIAGLNPCLLSAVLLEIAEETNFGIKLLNMMVPIRYGTHPRFVNTIGLQHNVDNAQNVTFPICVFQRSADEQHYMSSDRRLTPVSMSSCIICFIFPGSSNMGLCADSPKV